MQPSTPEVKDGSSSSNDNNTPSLSPTTTDYGYYYYYYYYGDDNGGGGDDGGNKDFAKPSAVLHDWLPPRDAPYVRVLARGARRDPARSWQ